jgi:hypothetical protein
VRTGEKTPIDGSGSVDEAAPGGAGDGEDLRIRLSSNAASVPEKALTVGYAFSVPCDAPFRVSF